MTTKMEQVVAQLQQELFALKAQVAARVQIAAALEWSAEQMTEISKRFHRSGIAADQEEPGTRSTRPGVHLAADAQRAYGYHDWRSERHCCQLAEELLGDVTTIAEET